MTLSLASGQSPSQAKVLQCSTLKAAFYLQEKNEEDIYFIIVYFLNMYSSTDEPIKVV